MESLLRQIQRSLRKNLTLETSRLVVLVFGAVTGVPRPGEGESPSLGPQDLCLKPTGLYAYSKLDCPNVEVVPGNVSGEPAVRER